jgi:hypothetical protein
MTPKQVQRLEKKIADIKRALAAEKRLFGGYDDSRGLRYLPTRYYIQLGDYKGGLTYTRWFAKAFPDDAGFADFLFEWTLLLFKASKFPEAQHKAWQTFCANTYVLDKFVGRPIESLARYGGSTFAQLGFADSFSYSNQQAELTHFNVWLEAFLSSDEFTRHKAQYEAISERLESETDRETRGYLIKQLHQLENHFKP